MDVWDALLGACLPVNTVRGERLLEVPAGVFTRPRQQTDLQNVFCVYAL
jgi:hypothetical protein